MFFCNPRRDSIVDHGTAAPTPGIGAPARRSPFPANGSELWKGLQKPDEDITKKHWPENKQRDIPA